MLRYFEVVDKTNGQKKGEVRPLPVRAPRISTHTHV